MRAQRIVLVAALAVVVVAVAWLSVRQPTNGAHAPSVRSRTHDDERAHDRRRGNTDPFAEVEGHSDTDGSDNGFVAVDLPPNPLRTETKELFCSLGGVPDTMARHTIPEYAEHPPATTELLRRGYFGFAFRPATAIRKCTWPDGDPSGWCGIPKRAADAGHGSGSARPGPWPGGSWSRTGVRTTGTNPPMWWAAGRWRTSKTTGPSSWSPRRQRLATWWRRGPMAWPGPWVRRRQ